MSGARATIRRPLAALALTIVVLAMAAGTSRAQYFGYGFPAGYGMYGGYYGYGYPGYAFGYGNPAFAGYGYGYPGFGYGFGYPAFAYSYPAYGAGLGYAYPTGLAYGGDLFVAPYWNPLFGVGTSPLGLQSFLSESNLFGRGQLAADQRARLRNAQAGRR
jgi:hypothetical protein